LSVRISVQLCTFNRRNLVRRSLDALFGLDFPASDYEIVLVDDGSSDGTEEMVSELRPPCRLVYQRQENSGLAAARNVGIRHSDGEVVLFIDDDIIADPGLLAAHWASHERREKLVVMGRVCHVDSLEGKLRPRFKLADLSTSFFWTSNCSVRRRHLEAAGLFDEDFREYGWEDIEMGLRLREIGLARRFNTRAVVYHFKSAWRASDLPALFRRAQASGRSAVVLLGKRPCARVRLSTGIFRARLALDDLLRGAEPYLRSRVAGRVGELSGLPLACARMLVSFKYFEAVRCSLADREQS
jgi:glycosyltransferase involved in cell wall biosynthesis